MILTILQARMSSSRLPGKVMLPVCGKPIILHQIDRIRRMKTLEEMVVATSCDSSDHPLAQLCADNNIKCYCGSLDDVLSRFYYAASCFSPDFVVRLTGDCPLFDPEVGDEVVKFCLKNGYDYASNTITSTFPDGCDIEIFRLCCLEEAHRYARSPEDREHVTPWIRRQERYRLGNYEHDPDLSKLRWTLDYPEDFTFIKKVYEQLYPKNPEFRFTDIMDYLDA